MTSQTRAISFEEPKTIDNIESSSLPAMRPRYGDGVDAPAADQVTGTSDIEKDAMKDKEESDTLDWDGPDDPENPMNWPNYKRRMQVICIAVITLVAYVDFCLLHLLLCG